jgi:hypothetical protein
MLRPKRPGSDIDDRAKGQHGIAHFSQHRGARARVRVSAFRLCATSLSFPVQPGDMIDGTRVRFGIAHENLVLNIMREMSPCEGLKPAREVMTEPRRACLPHFPICPACQTLPSELHIYRIGSSLAQRFAVTFGSPEMNTDPKAAAA